jgi:pyrroloquinoline quinone (PQQ) biosynthesis protein C
LHYTITTGAIATKEAAARYALETFEPRWQALIADALAYWRGEPASQRYRWHPHRRRHHATEFVTSVISDANRIARK